LKAIILRDTDFRDMNQSVVLARDWLQSKVDSVNQFDKNLTMSKRSIKEGKPTGSNEPDSYRSIAKFLSINGKTIFLCDLPRKPMLIIQKSSTPKTR
jgi:hypothetical protein